MRITGLVLSLLPVIAFVAPRADAADGPAKAGAAAGSRIETLLIKRCLECHAAEQQGGLDLRTRATALKGGDSGAVIEPGKPEESLLYEFVEQGQMPPKHRLSADEVAVFKSWITDGAPFPERALDPHAFTTEHRAGYDWWSLQPVQPVAVPEIAEAPLAERVRNPVDAFVARKLAERRLTFSPEVDRATYIRRVTVDLHGLPPTYEEVREFVADTRPDAYERLVDRLLASPRYGERWGRHWLDVVRYAETNGFERDKLRPNFWRYRDYVIQAFNRDLPYNDFVREQIAGDAIRPNDPQALIATGFLVAGPKNDVGTISELEQMTTRQDELDEIVVATGTTFLGLTVGCARCHDHKFDPITMRDYYGLTAVFSGLDRADQVTATAEERQQYDAKTKPLRDQIARAKGEIEALLQPARTQLAEKAAADLAKTNPEHDLPAVTVELNRDTFPAVPARFVRMTVLATNTGSEPCIDEFEVYSPDVEGNVALASAGGKASASSELPGFAIHKIAHLNDGKTGNEFSWISSTAGTGWAQIELPRVVPVNRVAWGRDRNRVYSDRLPVAYRIEVSVDGTEWNTVSRSERRPKATPVPAAKIPLPDLLAALDPAGRSRYEALTAEVARHEADLNAIPALPVDYRAIDREPRDAFVLRRGNVRERGDKVEPSALAALQMLNNGLRAEQGDSGPERRRRLAEWIVDPRNPLTARVIVNRVWHYHFNQGLVTTPSDFGFNGDRPSHPELLDWLAADFVAHGWRFKQLHRLVVLSATYRQASQIREECAAVDGNNRLLWRMNPRRLESEAVRDAVLQTSGTLNPQIGGPSFRLFEYRDGNVPDYLLLERPGPETWRRSVYNFNTRSFHEPLMTVFDCPDPSVQTPRRERSTTALQALSLMNNPFVFEQSQRFAARVEAQPGARDDVAEQVAAAYRLAFARQPTDAERQRAIEFVKVQGLFSLCRVLLNSNEFLYVQ